MAEDILITQLTATYAALVATGAAAWNFYRDKNDVGKLRIKCGFRELITPGVGIERDVLAHTITNIGRRPVYLTTVGGYFSPENGFILSDDQLPKWLAPGEYHISMRKEFEHLWNGVLSLEAYDSIGNTYKASKADIREVNIHLSKLKEKKIKRSWHESISSFAKD